MLQRSIIAVIALAGILSLTLISGLSSYALATSSHVLDRAPIWLGVEAELTVELKRPIPVEELPSLANSWGVRVDGFQHTYPAPHRPVTMGAAVPADADLRSAVERHREGAFQWTDARLTRMTELVSRVSDPDSMQANIEDLQEVRAQLIGAGVQVSLLKVRGTHDALARVASDQLVQRMESR